MDSKTEQLYFLNIQLFWDYFALFYNFSLVIAVFAISSLNFFILLPQVTIILLVPTEVPTLFFHLKIVRYLNLVFKALKDHVFPLFIL